MLRRLFLTLLLCTTARAAEPNNITPPPNIVVILADDLGYGDLRCYNPEGKIPTPNLDRMAAEGMRFTDAHSASAVCTPTRYGLLTGRYCWRTRLKKGVLGGWSPHLLEEKHLTVAALLKAQGYRTACIGKWHLGMDWPAASGSFGDDIEPARKWQDVDFTKPITHGPNAAGFENYFGISASLDMPPFAFLQDDKLIGKLTATKTLLRTGPATPEFAGDLVVPTLVEKARSFLTQQAIQQSPYFLYLALTSPHTPVLPSPAWKGKSDVGPYGDFVMETDAAVGEILSLLRGQNTLVIFTSDNGATPDNVKTLTARAAGHKSNAPWRGAKSDIWEGGHRVPFIARWPGHTPAGAECHDPVCLNTLIATAADLTGTKLPAAAGPDSFSIAPWLRGGKPDKPTHPFIIHHSIEGLFAIRRGGWKFIDGKGSGGWSKDPPVPAAGQLYNVATDPAEQTNLYEKEPAIVTELSALLTECREACK